jgi:tape measure domain-containing protein
MATENIQIVVSETGAKTVARNIEEIGGSSSKANAAVDLLKGALAGLGAAFAVSNLIKVSDDYSNLISRLKLVTKGTEDLNNVNAKLFAMAQRAGVSYTTLGETFVKVTNATKSLGLSQERVLKFTDLLSKSVATSGASSEEAAGALRQLAQGLASGTLRGDELNSVLEQLPNVAETIASGIGVTVGQLRAMGEQGKITGKDIIDAFDKMEKKIDGDFAKKLPTISGAFVKLSNAFTKLVGEAGQNSGGVTLIAQGIEKLADKLPQVINGVIALGFGFAGLIAAKTIGGIFDLVRGVGLLNAVLLANPLVAFATALGFVIGLLLTFGEDIKLNEEGTVSLKDVTVQAFKVIGGAIGTVIDWLKSLGQWFADIFNGALGWIDRAAKGLERLIGLGQKYQANSGGFTATTTPGQSNATIRAATGASFTVPGQGGTDSHLVQFMATPGEKVTVQTPGQVMSGSLPGSGPMRGGYASGGSFTLLGGSDTSSNSAPVPVQLSGSSVSAFATSVSSATTPGFQQLSSDNAALQQITADGTGKIVSGVRGVGGNLEPIKYDTSKTALNTYNTNTKVEQANQTFKTATNEIKSLDSTTSSGFSQSIDSIVSGSNGTIQAVRNAGDQIVGAVRVIGDNRSSGLSTSSGTADFDKLRASQGGGGGTTSSKPKKKDDFSANIETTAGPTVSGRWVPLDFGGFQTLYKMADAKGALRDTVGSAQQLAYQYARLTKFDSDLYSPDANAFRQTYKAKFQRLYQSLGDDGFQKYFGILAPELKAFRDGGSFMVGGSGATDSEVVAFRASANEQVEVLTPAQQKARREAARSGAGGRAVSVTLQINGADVNAYRKNKDQIYRELGQVISKAIAKG